MSADSVVHLIDDDEDVRRALAFLLGTAGFAVKVYESADRFFERRDGFEAGCVITDVRMPGMDGIQLLRRMGELGVRTPVIVMTGHADVALAVAAMKAGAVDFIEKPFADETLLAAIRAALARRLAAHAGNTQQVRERLASLTPREREVLDGLLAGQPNKTIAYDLGLSPRTVEVHRANVMTKMGASSLSELVRMALSAQ
ncbi:MAG TPA: response regulator FixJ [Rhizomicrobium sp.]|nr:response regulator FixJ [Rhizomicrobium sp.]